MVCDTGRSVILRIGVISAVGFTSGSAPERPNAFSIAHEARSACCRETNRLHHLAEIQLSHQLAGDTMKHCRMTKCCIWSQENFSLLRSFLHGDGSRGTAPFSDLLESCEHIDLSYRDVILKAFHNVGL